MQTRSVDAYKTVKNESNLQTANPHRIVQLLFEGALEKIAIAKGAMERQSYAHSGAAISLAIGIVDGLRMSLDKSIDHEIVHNLDALYEYINNKLLEANRTHDPLILDELSALLTELKSGWEAIPESEHDAHQHRNRYLSS